MDGKEFLGCLAGITGGEEANRYARRFGDLDAIFHGELLNYEALALYAYSTAMNWHNHINGELWTRRPSQGVITFTDVLNGALKKLPLHVLNDRIVYRGYRHADLTTFLSRYVPGGIVDFPGFTSASFKEENAFGGNVLFIIRTLTARVIWQYPPILGV